MVNNSFQVTISSFLTSKIKNKCFMLSRLDIGERFTANLTRTFVVY